MSSPGSVSCVAVTDAVTLDVRGSDHTPPIV
jgi:hypothetical protein